MEPTDYFAQPAPSITMTKPFSASLSVHVPRIAGPILEDMIEDRINAAPITFSHPQRVDLTWSPPADEGLFG